MRLRIITTCTAAVSLAAAVAASAARPNFTGTWELDQTQSHSIPPNMKQTMTVKHEGDSLSVETKIVTPQGERVQKDAYTLDGKETEFTPPPPQWFTSANPPLPTPPAGKGKRTTRWLPNDAGFVIEDEIIQQAAPHSPDTETINVARKWRTWPDGTLSIETMTQSPRGEFNNKRVFVKK